MAETHLYGEPGLEEALEDPIVRLVMQCDGVEASALLPQLRRLAARLCAPSKAKTARGFSTMARDVKKNQETRVERETV